MWWCEGKKCVHIILPTLIHLPESHLNNFQLVFFFIFTFLSQCLLSWKEKCVTQKSLLRNTLVPFNYTTVTYVVHLYDMNGGSKCPWKSNCTSVMCSDCTVWSSSHDVSAGTENNPLAWILTAVNKDSFESSLAGLFTCNNANKTEICAIMCTKTSKKRGVGALGFPDGFGFR